MSRLPALGLFGGTFDPIHAAHLRMAQAFRNELQLDEVRLIPAGQPYHRQQGPHASPAQRLEMVQLAIAGLPGLCVDDREVHRHKPAYTIDTLEEIRAEIGPDRPLWWLIGGDSLASLHRWHRWEALFTQANIAVALRPGFVDSSLPQAVRTQWQQRQVTDFSNAAPSGTMRPLTLPPLDVSATAIRQRLHCGADTSTLLSAPVLAYIRQHRLYL